MEDDFSGGFPPHVVGLANGSDDNSCLKVDTELDIVRWSKCPPE